MAVALKCVTDEEGNYDSPVLQKLFFIWDEYDAGEIDEDEVLDVLDRIEDLTLTQIQQMEEEEEVAEDPEDPDRLAILTAFHTHLDGVDKMRDFFHVADPELVDEALDIIQQATNQMMEGLRRLILSDQPAAKLCLKCSVPNAREARFCCGCNAVLPVLAVIEEPGETSRLISIEGQEYDGGAEGSPATTTPNFLEVSRAYDAWSQKALSDQDFLAVLLAVRRRHQADLEDLTRLLKRPRAESVKQYLLARAGVVVQNWEAMTEIVAALEAKDAAGVEDGMDSLDLATVAVLELEKAWRDAS